MRVLVTGASGFAGKAVVAACAHAGLETLALVRTPGTSPAIERVVPDLALLQRFDQVLEGADAVVHLANLAHVALDDRAAIERARALNVEATGRLAQQAAGAGVRRFIYVSSLKVHGEETRQAPFDEDSALCPGDEYARLKCESEACLARVHGDMQVIVLRAPLMYGPHVKANFLRLMRAVARGMPLPLSGIRNRRSLLYVGNLAGAIVHLLAAPEPRSRAYLLSDGAPVSTPELVRAIARAMQREVHMAPVPPLLLEALGVLVGRGASVRRLTRSLELDDSRIRAETGWQPAYGFEQALAHTVAWFGS